MVGSMLLATLGLVAAPVAIRDVTTATSEGRMTVTVVAEAPIALEAARGEIQARTLQLHIRNASRTQRWFGEGPQRIRTHRLPGELEITVPLGSGSECRGPVRLESAATGLRASVGCGANAHVPGSVQPSSAPVTSAAAATQKAATVPASNPHVPAPALVIPAPRLSTGGTFPSPPARHSLAGPPPPRATRAEPTHKPAPSPIGTGVLGPAVLLGAIAVAAVVFSRRRARVSKLIQIVESQSLGPKRALVVARVGDDTLILGSSEAGITVLATRPRDARGAATPVHPSLPPSVSVPEPQAGEVGLLARMLSRRRQAEPAPPFDSVLYECSEAQSLAPRSEPTVASDLDEEAWFREGEEWSRGDGEDHELREKLAQAGGGTAP